MKLLEINKENLLNNLNTVKEKILNTKSDTKIIAVVKANGMGLGLIEYSKFLIENGITILAVATCEEAIRLRKENIKEEILMLSPTIVKKELQLLIENDITLTIGSLEELKLIEEILEDTEKENVNVHIKIDTGFGRYGFLYTNKEEILEIFKENERVNIEGIYTHFSNPINEKWTRIQFNRFMDVVSYINEQGYEPNILHCSASTAFLKYPDMNLNAVRLGSVLQGRTLVDQNEFKKIGVFKTVISEIKTLPKGYNVSYCNTYKTKKETTVAIIPVGYVDGLNKDKKRDDFSLKNNLISVMMEIKKLFKDNTIKVKINNNYYKIIGKIGMYHAIVDITKSNDINVGDEVQIDITPLQTNDEIRREYV